MEFKKFVFIVWERKSILFFTLSSVIFLSLFWYFVQPEEYKVVFSIDIARENFQQTKDYRYDQFYRLQADEKFSETVVQWFKSPELVNEIKKKYQGDTFSMGDLNAERLSSNFIRVSFKIKNKEEADLLVKSIEETLIEKNSAINEKSSDPNWFSFIIGSSLVARHQFNLGIIVIGAFLIGSILGMFLSLFHYYWQSDESRN